MSCAGSGASQAGRPSRKHTARQGDSDIPLHLCISVSSFASTHAAILARKLHHHCHLNQLMHTLLQRDVLLDMRTHFELLLNCAVFVVDSSSQRSFRVRRAMYHENVVEDDIARPHHNWHSTGLLETYLVRQRNAQAFYHLARGK